MIGVKKERTYLDLHHLQVKHLHLNLGLRNHTGGKSWAKRNAIWIHPTSALVLRETIDRTIDSSSHGYIPILRDVLVKILSKLILLLLWEIGGVIMRGRTTEIERRRRSGINDG